MLIGTFSNCHHLACFLCHFAQAHCHSAKFTPSFTQTESSPAGRGMFITMQTMLLALLTSFCSPGVLGKRLVASAGRHAKVPKKLATPDLGQHWACVQYPKTKHSWAKGEKKKVFCLVEASTLAAFAEENSQRWQGAKDTHACEAKSKRRWMKICGLKSGSLTSASRLSYKTRWYYPRVCFREIDEGAASAGKLRVPVLEVEFRREECKDAGKISQADFDDVPVDYITDENMSRDWFEDDEATYFERESGLPTYAASAQPVVLSDDFDETDDQHDQMYATEILGTEVLEEWLEVMERAQGHDSVDITRLLEDFVEKERSGQFRCCCDASFASSWMRLRRGRRNLCKIIPSVAKCGKAPRPSWAGGPLHHYRRVGGSCLVEPSDVEAIYRLFEYNPPAYCPGFEGSALTMGAAHMDEAVPVWCTPGYIPRYSLVECKFATPEYGLFVPEPHCDIDARSPESLVDITQTVRTNDWLERSGALRCCCDVPTALSAGIVCEIFLNVMKCGSQKPTGAPRLGRMHHYSKAGGSCMVSAATVQATMDLIADVAAGHKDMLS